MAAALARGFKDPVRESQAAFKVAMMALAQPGSIRVLATDLEPPAPLWPATAALALTLCDYETPVWLDEALSAEPAVADYLRFHTGTPIVAEPHEAAFAFAADGANLPPLDTFALGTLEYPDRSATLVIQVERIDAGGPWRLTGPGIAREAGIGVSPVPLGFHEQIIGNHKLFPRGVDLIFVGQAWIVGVPRSTILEV